VNSHSQECFLEVGERRFERGDGAEDDFVEQRIAHVLVKIRLCNRSLTLQNRFVHGHFRLLRHDDGHSARIAKLRSAGSSNHLTNLKRTALLHTTANAPHTTRLLPITRILDHHEVCREIHADRQRRRRHHHHHIRTTRKEPFHKRPILNRHACMMIRHATQNTGRELRIALHQLCRLKQALTLPNVRHVTATMMGTQFQELRRCRNG